MTVLSCAINLHSTSLALYSIMWFAFIWPVTSWYQRCCQRDSTHLQYTVQIRKVYNPWYKDGNTCLVPSLHKPLVFFMTAEWETYEVNCVAALPIEKPLLMQRGLGYRISFKIPFSCSLNFFSGYFSDLTGDSMHAVFLLLCNQRKCWSLALLSQNNCPGVLPRWLPSSETCL